MILCIPASQKKLLLLVEAIVKYIGMIYAKVWTKGFTATNDCYPGKMFLGMYLGEIARLVVFQMMERGLLFRGTSLSAFARGYALTRIRQISNLNSQRLNYVL